MDGMDSRRSVSSFAERVWNRIHFNQVMVGNFPLIHQRTGKPTAMVLGFLFGSCIGLIVSGMEARRLLTALAAWQMGPTSPDASEQHWRLATVLMC